MRILEYLRNKVFWILDSRKGGKIKSSYDLLSKIEGNNPMPDDEVDAYHRKALERLLRHCVKTVPAYSHLGYTLSKESPIDYWPVVNKLSFKDISKGENDHLSYDFQKDSLIAMKTSGSTGTPFTC